MKCRAFPSYDEPLQVYSPATPEPAYSAVCMRKTRASENKWPLPCICHLLKISLHFRFSKGSQSSAQSFFFWPYWIHSNNSGAYENPLNVLKSLGCERLGVGEPESAPLSLSCLCVNRTVGAKPPNREGIVGWVETVASEYWRSTLTSSIFVPLSFKRKTSFCLRQHRLPMCAIS